MINRVKTVASSSSSTADRRGSGKSPRDASEPLAPFKPQIQDEPLRLVVEPTTSADGYTYKLFDRVTGELLMELPRETATSMSQDPNYSAGQIFDAKA